MMLPQRRIKTRALNEKLLVMLLVFAGVVGRLWMGRARCACRSDEAPVRWSSS